MFKWLFIIRAVMWWCKFRYYTLVGFLELEMVLERKWIHFRLKLSLDTLVRGGGRPCLKAE